MRASTVEPTEMMVRVHPGILTSVLRAASWCIFVALLGTALAEDLPPNAIRDVKGIEVRLEVPWTTLMLGERISYEFILSNASDKPIPVAIPLVKYEFGWPVGGQPYLDPKWKSGYETPPLEVRTAKWPPKGLDEGMGYPGIEAWGNLEPGYCLQWNQSRLAGDYFGALAYAGLESLTARWLAGPETWISSEPVPLKIVSVPMSQRREVFSGQWSSYGYGKDSRSGTAFVAPIEDKFFLFWMWNRVAEVAPDDEFEHQIDKDSTNLEITIRSKGGTRKVYYHLRQGLTRDTPWPIGPVKHLYPKPEPMPPDKLDALRKAAFPSPITTDGHSDKKPDLKMSTEVSKSPATGNAKRDWSWMVMGLAVIGGALILVIFRKLSQRAGINRDTNGNPQL